MVGLTLNTKDKAVLVHPRWCETPHQVSTENKLDRKDVHTKQVVPSGECECVHGNVTNSKSNDLTTLTLTLTLKFAH